MLSESEYDNALAAGVPNDVKVSHKFGAAAVVQRSGRQQGELHDCGIIYRTDRPYLACIMTKSRALDITKVEKTISALSGIIYTYATNDFKRAR